MDLALRTYDRLPDRVEAGRSRLGRPLTYAEKVLVAHLREPAVVLERGEDYADLDPDRVALQDALAQIVVLQFMTAGLDGVVVPTTVHCDHLIRARDTADRDLDRARTDNAEVYEFLRTASARYGIGFWEPGSGIIHTVVFENYAFPGGMMIGTDSHTPNAGGMGMIAVGVGGGDAIDAMTGRPFNVRWPKLIGVRLTGSLSGWCSAKDVILQVASRLTVSGGTGAIVEYFGPGVASITATGRATICNMGAEIGATTSVFPYDANTAAYLRATDRAEIADAADIVAADLRADPEIEDAPARFFDRVVEIDLSTLRPSINGPDTPDLAHDVGAVGEWARRHGVPTDISTALVGSCTNSSYEDLSRAASIARQATAVGLRAKMPLLVTPGSAQIRATVERDGFLADLEAIGATVLANACGPCIGQWDRAPDEAMAVNTIVDSYNRNFPKRNDGSATTKAFVTSPEMVVAYALAGTLDFDPVTDALAAGDGTARPLSPPISEALPQHGFASGDGGFVAPPANGPDVEVAVSPTSERLAAAGVPWCVVGDANYGEGSSREHAAMEPRWRGGRVVFARSFARIHETNLKRQGLLALTFADPSTYEDIGEDDRISVLELGTLAPGGAVRCLITKPDGTTVGFTAHHTMTEDQIEWFRAGSALNVIRKGGAGGRIRR